MLTIKQITENTEAVIRGLEKKHFKNAKETIEQVIALNDKRRSTQNQLDKNLAEVNSLSRTIGQLMKEGKKEEAETARARVAELKEGNKELDATMTQAATDMQNALYTIPNIPYELLTPNHLLYDLLYNPNVTLFMKKGEAQGAVVKNGLEMLLLQAFAAWEIWHK